MPKTLAIVLNWNSHAMTADCIRSLQNMSGCRPDILIVDNGSRDGSIERLTAAFPDITIIGNEHNLGFAAGCNIGMRLAIAKGYDFALLVNNDTIVEPKMLEELEAQFLDPSIGVVSPKIYFFDRPDRLWWAGGSFNEWTGNGRHIGWKQADCGQFNSPRDIDWFTGCVALLRCEALKSVGMFDEVLFGNAEDLDLSLRLRKAGYRIRYAPASALWHKEGFDYRRNVGEHVRVFMGVRNILWVVHKHISGLRLITFWPSFLVMQAAKLMIAMAMRKDWKAVIAVPKAILAFLKMRSNGGQSLLPIELRPKNDIVAATK